MNLDDVDLGNLGKKVLVGFVIALVCYGAFRACHPKSNKQNKTSIEFVENTYYTISSDTYAAYTKEALDAMVRYVTSNNREGVSSQIRKGEVINIDAGTKARLVKYGLSSCKVDIASGFYSGRTVYVVTEFLSR